MAGQLTRTWNYESSSNGLQHVITLYHDPLTGVRSATLDHEVRITLFDYFDFLIGNCGIAWNLLNIYGKFWPSNSLQCEGCPGIH
jgi:hypothetical protein